MVEPQLAKLRCKEEEHKRDRRGGEGVSYYYCLYALLKKVMFSFEGKRV